MPTPLTVHHLVRIDNLVRATTIRQRDTLLRDEMQWVCDHLHLESEPEQRAIIRHLRALGLDHLLDDPHFRGTGSNDS